MPIALARKIAIATLVLAPILVGLASSLTPREPATDTPPPVAAAPTDAPSPAPAQPVTPLAPPAGPPSEGGGAIDPTPTLDPTPPSELAGGPAEAPSVVAPPPPPPPPPQSETPAASDGQGGDAPLPPP